MKEHSYPQFSLPGADREIWRICEEKLRSLYGVNIPWVAEDRLRKELYMLKASSKSSVYLLLRLLSENQEKAGGCMNTRGAMGSTLVAFLLGISDTNPLPAHYRCSQCAHTEFAEAISGYDLAPKACPHCGVLMHGDGHNIPYEVETGLIPDPQQNTVEINVAASVWEQAVAFLVELLGEDRVACAGEWNNPVCFMLLPEGMRFEDITPLAPLEPPFGGVGQKTALPGYRLEHTLLRLILLPNYDYDRICKLRQLTGTRTEAIHYNDPLHCRCVQKETKLGLTNSEEKLTKQILGMLNNVHFSDLVRASGISHGTGAWQVNAEALIKEHPFSSLIGDRDDVLLTLQKYGVDRETAYAVMTEVRKGRFSQSHPLSQELEIVPRWYLESLFKIQYLFCKSHIVHYMKTALSLAWFRHHFPEQFFRVSRQHSEETTVNP